MLTDHRCRLIDHRPCGDNLSIMTLETIGSPFTCEPGQFVMLDLPDPRFFFRRPFSVLNVLDNRRFEIFYKIVGRGTQLMADLPIGQTLNVLGPLGNKFDVASLSTDQNSDQKNSAYRRRHWHRPHVFPREKIP